MIKRQKILKHIFNSVIITVVSFILSNINLHAQDGFSATIKPMIEPFGRTINLGPCLLFDSLRCDFALSNTGTKPLFMERLAPSYYLGASPNDPTQLQFNLYRDLPLLPKTFPPGMTDTIKIMFRAGDTLVSKPGWHEAMVAMSFLDDQTKDPPPVTKIDTFFIRVKKTLKNFDNFDDIIRFDSVYVNPTQSQTFTWRGKNTYFKNVFLKNRQINFITQNQGKKEFDFGEDINNLEVNWDGIVQRNFSYTPADMGFDSVKLKIAYIPRYDLNPDSLDYSETLVIGQGVEQKIEILNSNQDFRNDTIFLGDIRTGKKVNIIIALRNNGNIPIFAAGENVVDELSGKISAESKIEVEFQRDSKYIMPDSLAGVVIEFTPVNNGIFNLRYDIQTNLNDRKIKGVPQSALTKSIFIRGRAMSPVLSVSADTIDFGNIILNRIECPSVRDTVIRLSNSGNQDLIISNITINPEYPQSPFRLSQRSMEISPGIDSLLFLSFETISNEIKEHKAELIISSNEDLPQSQRKIILKVNTLPPITANLSISNDLKAKPGRIIEVPVVLKHDNDYPAKIASVFTSDINYDRSILEFIGTKTLGSATEGSLNKSDLSESDNKNYISLRFESIEGSYFKPKDTIAFLRFNTYLGDAVTTEIALLNPVFGDFRCSDILDLNVRNGIFTTDSVCGLEYKAIPKPKSKLYIKTFQTANYEEIPVEFSIPFKGVSKIFIYDNFGNYITELFREEMPSGIYQIKIDVRRFNSGLYYFVLENELTYTSCPVIIVK